MKRFLSLFCTLLVLCAALCATAAASDYDAVAQELSAIGMFRGTGESFELDREPTRAEAAVMLVRLYGAEEQARADYANGTIAHPFTDVPDWTAPYVAWLYTNGLTKGVTETTFCSADVCTDLNYATFLLRALGYQDGVDFVYSDALSFAEELGFYNAEVFAGPFLRDDLAALTYQALATGVKSGDTYLLAQLIANGAVDADAAQPMTEKMDAWYSLSKRLREEALAVECNTVMDCDAHLVLNDTVAQDMSMKSTVYTALIDDGETLQYAEVTETEYMGLPATSAIYVKDGWMYTAVYLCQMPLAQYKNPFTLDSIDEEELDADGETVALSTDGGILALEDITVENKSGNTVYTLIMGNVNLEPDVEDVSGDMDLEAMGEIISYEVEDIKTVYTFDANGQLLTSHVSYSLYVELVSYETGEPEHMCLEAHYDITVTYTAWNENVKIDFPDFSNYEEIVEEEYA